jgi:hypothetical protein
MQGSPPSAVTYVGLPVSSGGAHSLGRMRRRDALEQTMAFLRTCTEPDGEIEYAFRANDRPNVPDVARLRGQIHQRFGDGVLSRDNVVRVPEARVPDALEFLDAIEPQATDPYGLAPIWFWMTTKFRIRDPATGEVMPGQDPERYRGVEYEWRVPLGTSGLRLTLHNRSAIAIELCIPDADEAVVGRVAPWLQAHLPCRLSPKQWRRWTATKSGSFAARRMADPLA